MAACARPFSRFSFVLALGASLPALSPAISPAWAGAALIYVTNSAGDSIHVIDPATNKVVQEFKGVEATHGIAFAPDGSRVYVSNEPDSTSTCSTAKSGKLIKKCSSATGPTTSR